MTRKLTSADFLNAPIQFILIWEFNQLIQIGLATGVETKMSRLFSTPQIASIKSEKLIVKPFADAMNIAGMQVPLDVVHGMVLLDPETVEQDVGMTVNPALFVKYAAAVDKELKRVKKLTGYNPSKTFLDYLKWWHDSSTSIQTDFTYMTVESCLERLRNSPQEITVIEGSCPEKQYEKMDGYTRKILFKAFVSASEAVITFYKSVIFKGVPQAHSSVSSTIVNDVNSTTIIKKINGLMRNMNEDSWKIDRVFSMKEEKELF